MFLKKILLYSQRGQGRFRDLLKLKELLFENLNILTLVLARPLPVQVCLLSNLQYLHNEPLQALETFQYKISIVLGGGGGVLKLTKDGKSMMHGSRFLT